MSGSTVPWSPISGYSVGSGSSLRVIELGLSWYVISPLIAANRICVLGIAGLREKYGELARPATPGAWASRWQRS
jgi:hypothetical protein